MIKSYTDLDTYKLSYQLAIEIFKLTATFPSVEKYSLTDQIVRASRSICANIPTSYFLPPTAPATNFPSLPSAPEIANVPFRKTAVTFLVQ